MSLDWILIVMQRRPLSTVAASTTTDVGLRSDTVRGKGVAKADGVRTILGAVEAG
jgi:hypothetical protein